MRRIKLNSNFIIPVVFVFVFLPILSFTFGLKNDILTGYLPVRFFMSESLSAGYMPWWNPYVNFGLPQHADMSGGFWNPITWIIACTVGYNVYSITIELLFYILVGSLGMYKLGGLWKWTTTTRLIAAISYMGCGYFIGHIQHLNWVSAAGFLPFCVYAFIQILRNCNLNHLSLAAVCFYFFVSSSHPGLIIGAIYFFGLLSVGEFMHARTQIGTAQTFKKTGIAILLLLLVVLALSAGMIISYAEILPFITRDTKPVINDIQLNSSGLSTFISFLFPAAITRDSAFFLSDISLRNSYIGIIPFVFLLSAVSIVKSQKLLWGFLAGSIFFLLLSIPSPVQEFLYKIFPLLGYVRLPGEFRIFALFGLIILACTWLDVVLRNPEKQKPILTGCNLLIGLFAIVLMISLYQILLQQNSMLFSDSFAGSDTDSRSTLKIIAASASLYDLLFLQALVQIGLLMLIKKSMRTAGHLLLLFVCIADILVASTINMPFTGYGEKSTKELQQLLNAAPKGIPLPSLHPIGLNQQGVAGIDRILGSWSLYNKQPGNQKQANYPILFKSESTLFEEETMLAIQQRAFLYFEPDTAHHPNGSIGQSVPFGEIQLQAFTPGYVKAYLRNSTPGSLTLMYKQYPHWVCSVDGNAVKQQLSGSPFTTIKIDKTGSHLIEFSYSPRRIQWVALFNCLLFGVLLFIIIRRQLRGNRNPSNV